MASLRRLTPFMVVNERLVLNDVVGNALSTTIGMQCGW